MTASTHKGSNKKKAKTVSKTKGVSDSPRRKKRKNKLLLFLAVFCSVLVLGGASLLLLLLAGKVGNGQSIVRMGRDMTDQESAGDAALEENSAQLSILEKIAAAPESLFQNITSEQDATDTSRYGDLLRNPALMEANRIYAREAASGEETVLAFAGDILFDSHYAVMARLQQRGGDIEEAFSEELLAEMRSADIFMVNNEFPYSGRGTPLPDKQFTFRADLGSAAYLTEMGVDIVSLANNHAFDYGEESMLDTLDTLEAMDMPYVGAGRNLEEAKQPVSFLINDRRIAIVSATQIERNDNPDTRGAGEDSCGVFRCWNPDMLLQEIAEAKADNDIVIVYIHWGTENQAEIDWAQRDQAVKIAEAGADLIIGDHPHCLQPVGYVGDVPVIYSLGNFLFNSKTLDTCLVRVIVSKQGELSVQVLPAKQEDCRTRLLEGAEKQRVLEYLNSISDSGVLDAEGNLGKP